ncbi:spermidine/putrescine ABC transporter substrate-binding protein [Gordonia jinhuaensis]|uniref:polyamine ABC transporter substrate-binding protein n=1 Tax=Gordonia jinhuaensis TaxID=1517702 RepID=UPI00166DA4E0|nr:spermidine/putrescine ABC transporter substrate-binding protein [Gordonia jinhuaensis]
MPSPRTSRREFLRAAALLGISAPVLSATLQGCAKRGDSATATTLTLASPDHPVTWPIASDNQPIADGLAPEKGPLLVYNYPDYIAPDVVKSFEERYKVKVEVSTFNDADESIAKIRTGAVPFDVYIPSYDQISKLVTAKLIRPLNHTYLSNIDNVWPTFTNPWYDQQWRYTVPYTVYTTGIAWSSDAIGEDISTLSNPYESLWNPAYKNKVGLIDDWHTAMAMVLLRDGIDDVNTDSKQNLDKVAQGLSDMKNATNPKVTSDMYTQLPAGQLGISQMWSGDAVNAQYYLPKGQSADILRYWFPEDGKGLVDNDLMVVMRGGKNPVLAHLFLQHMLDTDNATKNFSSIGYQPPQRTLDTNTLVAQGYLPQSLSQAAVREDWFTGGYRLLELAPANDAAWHTVWQSFKAGV